MENQKSKTYKETIDGQEVKIVEYQGVKHVDMSELPKITGWPKSSTDRFALHHPDTAKFERKRIPGKTGRYFTLDEAKEVRDLMSKAETFSYSPKNASPKDAGEEVEESER